MRKTVIAAAMLMAMLPTALHSEDRAALDIMRKVDARDDGDNRTAKLTIVLVDRNGKTRTRALQTFLKDQGPDTRNLMFFLGPSSVRNTGFLTHDYREPERDDDQWLYLPELRKTKRIASSSKSQSFMGTDFSYADMTRRVLEEWTYRLLGEREVRGKPAWLVEAIPASKTIEQRYGYEKSVLFVRKDIDMVVRAVHWMSDGKRLKYLDIVDIQRIDGIWTAIEIDMRTVRNEKTEHRTVFRLEDVRYGQGLGEDLFTLRRLEKGI